MGIKKAGDLEESKKEKFENLDFWELRFLFSHNECIRHLPKEAVGCLVEKSKILDKDAKTDITKEIGRFLIHKLPLPADENKNIEDIEFLLNNKVCRDALPKDIFNFLGLTYEQRSQIAEKYINCLTEEGFDTGKFNRVGFSSPEKVETIKGILAKTKSLDEITRLGKFLVSSCIYTRGENRNKFISDITKHILDKHKIYIIKDDLSNKNDNIIELQTALRCLRRLEVMDKSKPEMDKSKPESEKTNLDNRSTKEVFDKLDNVNDLNKNYHSTKELPIVTGRLDKLEGVNKSKTEKTKYDNEKLKLLSFNWLCNNGYIDDKRVPERLLKYRNLRYDRDGENYKNNFDEIKSKQIRGIIASYIEPKKLAKFFRDKGFHRVLYGFDVINEDTIKATFGKQNLSNDKKIQFLKILNTDRREYRFDASDVEIFKSQLSSHSIYVFEKFIKAYGTKDDFRDRTDIKTKIDIFCLLDENGRTLENLLKYFFSKEQLQALQSKDKKTLLFALNPGRNSVIKIFESFFEKPKEESSNSNSDDKKKSSQKSYEWLTKEFQKFGFNDKIKFFHKYHKCKLRTGAYLGDKAKLEHLKLYFPKENSLVALDDSYKLRLLACFASENKEVEVSTFSEFYPEKTKEEMVKIALGANSVKTFSMDVSSTGDYDEYVKKQKILNEQLKNNLGIDNLSQVFEWDEAKEYMQAENLMKNKITGYANFVGDRATLENNIKEHLNIGSLLQLWRLPETQELMREEELIKDKLQELEGLTGDENEIVSNLEKIALKYGTDSENADSEIKNLLWNSLDKSIIGNTNYNGNSKFEGYDAWTGDEDQQVQCRKLIGEIASDILKRVTSCYNALKGKLKENFKLVTTNDETISRIISCVRDYLYLDKNLKSNIKECLKKETDNENIEIGSEKITQQILNSDKEKIPVKAIQYATKNLSSESLSQLCKLNEVNEYIEAENLLRDEIEKVSENLVKPTCAVVTKIKEIVSKCEDNPSNMLNTDMENYLREEAVQQECPQAGEISNKITEYARNYFKKKSDLKNKLKVELKKDDKIKLETDELMDKEIREITEAIPFIFEEQNPSAKTNKEKSLQEKTEEKSKQSKDTSGKIISCVDDYCRKRSALKVKLAKESKKNLIQTNQQIKQ